MAIKNVKPLYYLTIGAGYFKDENTTDVIKVETLKRVGITANKTEQTIYGSGKIYDYVSQNTSQDLAVDAIQLPSDLVRRYLGENVSTNGGFSFATTNDEPIEFAFGYATEYKSGHKEFKWYPRCKLITANETDETKTDSAIDPQRSYTIKAMPTDERLIRVRYNQSEVVEGKVALTEEEFFADAITSVGGELIDSETPSEVPGA